MEETVEQHHRINNIYLYCNRWWSGAAGAQANLGSNAQGYLAGGSGGGGVIIAQVTNGANTGG